jgi:hypothetical protein
MIGGAVGGVVGFLLGGGAGTLVAVVTGGGGFVAVPVGAIQGGAAGSAIGIAAGHYIGDRLSGSGQVIQSSETKTGSNGPVEGLTDPRAAGRTTSAETGAAGLASRGFRAPPGTREIPEGIPEEWRIRPTKGEGGVWYYDPKVSKGNAVRVMPGDPTSPFPNSKSPYVRWQLNGQPLDVDGSVLPSKYSPDAHVPLQDFRFNQDLFK